MLRIIMAVGLLVAGCAGQGRLWWVHPGYSEQRWATDRYECERQAQVPGLTIGMPIGGGMVAGVPMATQTDASVFSQCLEARGWRLMRQP